MKYNSDVYLSAAQRIFNIKSIFSCSAIYFSSKSCKSLHSANRHIKLYEEYFKDVEDCEHEYWMQDQYLLNNWPINDLSDLDKMREHRIMMLLLMSEIAKDLNEETK